MSGFLCAMVGATFATVTVAAQVLRSKKGIIAVANAQVDTAQSYFGGASALFDGNTDLLSVNGGIFLTADFTIEMWFRSGNKTGQLFGNVLTNTGPVAGQVVCYYSPSPQRLEIYFSDQTSVGYVTNTTMAINTWHHIAMVRSGSTIRCYVNGTQQSATKTFSGELGTTTYPTWHIGGIPGNLDCFNGHIDEIRFSNTARYTATFTPSTTPFVNDANTLLLIHANGTDASTFFEDDNGAGRSAKAITAIGNAQVDTAQSKFGGASLLMDGSGDRLNVTGEVLPAQYTVEYWFRLASFTSAPTFVDFRGGGAHNYSDFITTGGVFTVYINSSSIVTSALSTNTWYHIAVVRDSSSDIKLYLNGTKTGVTLNDASYGLNTSWYIGDNYLFVSSVDGHMDEIRVSNTARYTANFSVATTPFVNDANTVLLLHCDGTDGSTVFRDDNGIIGSTPNAITANGNAQISTAQSKFGGSSALFDGFADYLEIKSNLPALSFGTGDFTFEGWFRFANTTADMALYTGATSNGDLDIRRVDDNTVRIGRVNTAWDLISSATGITSNTWHHIAVVRQSTTLTIYVDGVSKGSTSNSINYTVASQIRIGSFSSGGGLSYNGYMDEMRVSNIARYTAAFTPSTTAFTQDSNTLLLIHADGANASTTFLDSAGRTQKGVQANGNAQVSTAQSKFGGSSALFDGTNDKLVVNGDFSQTGDFTFECWFRTTTVSGDRCIFAIGNEATDRQLVLTSGNDLKTDEYGVGGIDISPDNTVTTDTWHHAALTRSGTTVTLWFNGVSQGTITSSATIGNANNLYIGALSDDAIDYSGYIDEFRVSNTARYTAAFTPSTTPFQNDDNTILLLHMDGTDASTVFFDDNGAKPYTP